MSTKSLIVIVTYNSQDFIENCLCSVAGQSYNDWFLTVIDNNSNDNTAARVRKFADTYRGITENNFRFIILKKNIGFSGAVNYTVFNFISEENKKLEKELKFLILLNPDIFLKRNALQKLISTFKIGKDHYKPFKITGAAGGLILDYKKDTIQHLGGKIEDNFITSHIGYGINYHDWEKEYKPKRSKKNVPDFAGNLKDADYITGAFFATEFQLFKALGGFDPGYTPLYFEELDYCLKIKRTGRQVVVNHDSVARHFEGASVKKFSKDFYKYYHKNRIRCAVINLGFLSLFRKFICSELAWLKNSATADQIIPVLYAYFLNFIFLPYNLIIKLKNHLILNKLELK
jgi:GT2 family glycosyltransferase